MLKPLMLAALGCGILLGAAAVSAQTLAPRPPHLRYQLPPAVAGSPANGPYEGRSVYSVDPSRFPNHVDERGYVSGMPENPQF